MYKKLFTEEEVKKEVARVQKEASRREWRVFYGTLIGGYIAGPLFLLLGATLAHPELLSDSRIFETGFDFIILSIFYVVAAFVGSAVAGSSGG